MWHINKGEQAKHKLTKKEMSRQGEQKIMSQPCGESLEKKGEKLVHK